MLREIKILSNVSNTKRVHAVRPVPERCHVSRHAQRLAVHLRRRLGRKGLHDE